MKALMSIVVAVAFTLALPVAAQEKKAEKPAAGAAQEKQRISYRAPASFAKYTQQHVIDVGDASGHLIRLLEVQRTFTGSSPAETPIFNGVKVTEQWARGVSDYVDANGRVFGYAIYNMENGDKVFARYEGLAQTPAGGKTNVTYVFTFTGGTGKFKDLRGLMRGTGVVSFAGGKAGSIDTQYEGEYWFER